MEDLAPLGPGENAPAPQIIADFIDDQPDNSPPAKAVLKEERDAAMRAEYHWPVWDAEQRAWQPQRLIVSADRWTWWKILRTHQAPINLDDDRELDLDTFAPQAWGLLWLCLHSPEDILLIIADPKHFWLRVNEWAVIHCPPAKWHEAIELMNTIRGNISVLLTVPLPTRRARRLGE
jgi:hypothetical protein